jgi:hypothetical protein
MIELDSSADPQSREIVRVQPDGRRKRIGYLMWHSGRPPHVQITEAFEGLTLDELKQCLDFHNQREERERDMRRVVEAKADGQQADTILQDMRHEIVDQTAESIDGLLRIMKANEWRLMIFNKLFAKWCKNCGRMLGRGERCRCRRDE